MTAYDYDLFVLGAGSGGVRASRMAAAQGARVAVAEERELGGTCVNVGCIPKKLFVYASHFEEDFADAEGFGWSIGPRRFDWNTLRENKDREIARLNGVYGRLLEQAGVALKLGHAHLEDAHTVAVGEQRFTAETILVAVGGWPELPAIPGIEHGISSNEVFHLKEFPERLVVVGGGYVAVEFAGAFNGMGAEVVQLYRGEPFLRGFDEDIRTSLADEMRKKGIDLRYRAQVASLVRTETGVRATLEGGGTLEADQVLFATGRTPLTADLGLEAAGVALGARGEVLVDEFSRSSAPNVYAIGDCTDRLNLTPMAIHEAMAFVRTVYHGEPTAPDHSDVATAVFSQPTVGTVGLTEAEARERHPGDVAIFRSRFRPLKHTLSGRDEQSMLKLVVQRSSDRVLGAHMVGPEAGEILQGLGIALRCGATKAQLDATVGIHPTTAEEFVTMREPVED